MICFLKSKMYNILLKLLYQKNLIFLLSITYSIEFIFHYKVFKHIGVELLFSITNGFGQVSLKSKVWGYTIHKYILFIIKGILYLL